MREEIHVDPSVSTVPPVHTVSRLVPAAVKRISWAAVFAGLTVALGVQLILSLLGIGIGATTIDPLTEQNPMSGIGLGTGIWFMITSLIALFAGGWVAGRMAGIPRNLDSVLHGFLTWGLVTLLTFYLLTTTVGSLISGAAGVLGKTLSAVGQGVAAVAPEAASALGSEMQQRGIDWGTIKQEARALLQQTGKPQLQPQNIQNQAADAAQDMRKSAGDAAQNPQAAETELNNAITRLFNRAEGAVNAADREALINVLVARTNMSRAEATQTVDRWEQTYQQARAQYEQTKAQVEQKTRETADAAAKGLAKAALWTFVIMLLSAGAAALGGYIGTPRDLPSGVARSV